MDDSREDLDEDLHDPVAESVGRLAIGISDMFRMDRLTALTLVRDMAIALHELESEEPVLWQLERSRVEPRRMTR